MPTPLATSWHFVGERDRAEAGQGGWNGFLEGFISDWMANPLLFNWGVSHFNSNLVAIQFHPHYIYKKMYRPGFILVHRLKIILSSFNPFAATSKFHDGPSMQVVPKSFRPKLKGLEPPKSNGVPRSGIGYQFKHFPPFSLCWFPFFRGGDSLQVIEDRLKEAYYGEMLQARHASWTNSGCYQLIW